MGGHSNASHTGGDQGNDPAKITGTIAAPADAFAAYLNQLEKANAALLHYTETEKAEIEIKQLMIKATKEQQDIDFHNTEIRMGLKKGQIKEDIDFTQIAKETALIRERAAAMTHEAAMREVNVTFETQMKGITDGYNQSVQKSIDVKKVDAITLADRNEKEKIQIATQNEINKMFEQGVDDAEAINAVYNRQQQALDEVTASTKKARAAQDDWLGNGVQQYITSLGTMNQGLEKLVVKGLGDFSTNLTNLITTGKGSFKQMIASMIQDLANLLIQMTVVIPIMEKMKSMMGISGSGGGGAGGSGMMGMIGSLFSSGGGDQNMLGSIASMFGYANGGAFSGGVQMFADGGVVGSPTAFSMGGGKLGVMGEKDPEAVMPLQRGSDGKLGVIVTGSSQGAGGTTNSVVIQNINVNADQNTDGKKVGQQIGDQIKMIVLQTLNNERRSGNSLNPATAF